MIDRDRAAVTLELLGLRVRYLATTVFQLAGVALVAYGGWGIFQHGTTLPTRPFIAWIPELSPDPLVQEGLLILAGALLAGFATRT